MRSSNRTTVAFLAVALALLVGTAAMAQECGETWSMVSPLPQGNTLRAVTWGGGLWVAVGNAGTVLTSPDGDHWTIRNSGTAANLLDVCYGDSTFVAVGIPAGSGATVLRSADGVNWASAGDISAFPFHSVAWGSDAFVATSASYGTYYSPDGNSWTFGAGSNPFGIAAAYGGSRFVVLSGGTSSTSPDGATWTPHYDANLQGINPTSLAYGASKYVAIGTYGICTSTDGATWLKKYSEPAGTDIARGTTSFIAVGGEMILTSTDGNTWRTVALPFANEGKVLAIGFGNGSFRAAGQAGQLLASTSGTAWTRVRPAPASPWQGNLADVVYGGSNFVTGCRDGAMLTSADGLSWAKHSLPSGDYPLTPLAAAYGNGRYVAWAFEDSGYSYAYTSADGNTWVRGSSELPGVPYPSGLAFGNSVFVLVCYYGIVFTSPDGETWTQQVSGAENLGNAWAITFGGSLFFAWSDWPDAPLISSPDGIHWSPVDTGAGSQVQMQAMVYGGGQFVGLGYAGAMHSVFTSPDGAGWVTYGLSSTFPGVCDLAFGNGYYVGCSPSGHIVSSPDALSWLVVDSPPDSSHALSAVAYGAGRFIAVTSAGSDLAAILRSECAPSCPADFMQAQVGAAANSSAAGWLDTGLSLGVHDLLTVEATGVSCTWGNAYCFGPAGDPLGTPLNGCPSGSLVGRIGASGTPICLGESFSGTAAAAGNLFLAVNDADPSDNAGGFQACARVTPSSQCEISCDASADPSSGPPPLNVFFASAASATDCTGPLSYAWNLGDGAGSSEQNPAHAYTVPGIYEWEFAAAADGVSCPRSGSIAVWNPDCDLDCSTEVPASGQVGVPHLFEGSAFTSHCTETPVFGWDFGDGATSVEPSPSHAFGAAGSYAWTFEARADGLLCTRSGTVVVRLRPGDCNGDGLVTIGELQKAINMFLATAPASCGADCNGDGNVSIGELQKVINAFLGTAASC